MLALRESVNTAKWGAGNEGIGKCHRLVTFMIARPVGVQKHADRSHRLARQDQCHPQATGRKILQRHLATVAVGDVARDTQP